MKNFGKYHNKTDVFLLADIFMNYTIMCLKNNGLNSFYYVFVLEIFNDLLYKSSEIKFKFMIDMSKYLMVEMRSVER
jgi:hypothetical protein